MTFYDRTKEDVRPWRETQDNAGQAKDDTAQAKAVEIQAETDKGGVSTGVTVTPASVLKETMEASQQYTASPIANQSGTTTEWKFVDWAERGWTAAGMAVVFTLSPNGLVTAKPGQIGGQAKIQATISRTVKGVKTELGSGTGTFTLSVE